LEKLILEEQILAEVEKIMEMGITNVFMLGYCHDVNVNSPIASTIPIAIAVGTVAHF
jgi:hypothetical protein